MPTIRPASATEAAALAAFAARTFRETYAPPFGDCDPADVEAYVPEHFGVAFQAAELGDAAMRTLVAADGDAIAGYAQLRLGSWPADSASFAPLADPRVTPLLASADVELARLYVDRPWHGRGLAALLLAAACATARTEGGRTLWCSVYGRNARALAFYRRQGACAVATATFQMGADRQQDWLLALPLTPQP